MNPGVDTMMNLPGQLLGLLELLEIRRMLTKLRLSGVRWMVITLIQLRCHGITSGQ